MPSNLADRNYGLRCELYDPSLNIHVTPLDFPEALAPSAAEPELSLPALQRLRGVQAGDMNTQIQNWILNGSAYWRGEYEKKVFGDGKTAVEEALPSILKEGQLSEKDQTFLRDTYSPLLHLWQLSRNDHYSVEFSREQRDKLDCYWSGQINDTKCLARRDDFNELVSIAHAPSFIKHATAKLPNFQEYIDDSEHNWAKQLYDALIDNDVLDTLAWSVISGQDLVNQHCMVLSALTKDGTDYDIKLWKRVRDKAIALPMYQGGGIDMSEFPDFSSQCVSSFIQRLQDNDPAISDGLKEAMNMTNINGLYGAFEVSSAQELANRMFSTSSYFGNSLLAAFKKIGGLRRNLSKMSKAMEEVQTDIQANQPTKWPRLKKAWGAINVCVSLAMQGYQFYTSIKALMDWDNLSPDEIRRLVLPA